MEQSTIKVGDTVRYLSPMADESGNERFVVTELNGDRGYMEYVCGMRIRPLSLFRIGEIVKVDSHIPQLPAVPEVASIND